MRRRHRLSRSRDFDAVYRHGKSVSTRYLVLYAFPRGEDADESTRLGLAVSRRVGDAVERNRIKRLLREVFAAVEPSIAHGCDYVLVVRPGLVESTHSRGLEWLTEQVREVFELSPAARESAPR